MITNMYLHRVNKKEFKRLKETVRVIGEFEEMVHMIKNSDDEVFKKNYRYFLRTYTSAILRIENKEPIDCTRLNEEELLNIVKDIRRNDISLYEDMTRSISA